MGQATVDLPDPLELPPVDHNPALPISAAALASADDLLSQLAGDDIDRLLAEAENADTPPATDSSRPDPSVKAAADHAERVRMAEQTVADVAGEDAESVTEAAPEAIEPGLSIPPAADPVAPDEASALQSMMPTIVATESVIAQAVIAEETAAIPTEIPAEPAATPTVAEIVQVEVDVASPEPAAVEMATSAERHALAEAPPAGPPSVLVRVLQFVNSPLAWLPDPLRDSLGKVGLLTMFNALAVLGYVLLFRGKHPH